MEENLENSEENMIEIEIELSDEDYEFVKNSADSRCISIDELIQEALQTLMDKIDK